MVEIRTHFSKPSLFFQNCLLSFIKIYVDLHTFQFKFLLVCKSLLKSLSPSVWMGRTRNTPRKRVGHARSYISLFSPSHCASLTQPVLPAPIVEEPLQVELLLEEPLQVETLPEEPFDEPQEVDPMEKETTSHIAQSQAPGPQVAKATIGV